MRVPDRHVVGLGLLARFSDEDIARTLVALDDPESKDVEQTVETLSKQIAFSADEIARALEAAMSLANARADFGSSIPDFVEDLLKSIKEDSRKELQLPLNQREQLKKNLNRLLADEMVVIASKTIYLRRDYEHRFCRARILTDIRPVFGEDRNVAPSTAIINHALQLVYHEGSATKEIHVALDSDDLSSLKLQIERAQEKEKSLTRLLTNAKVTVILD